MSDVTYILSQIENGDPSAAEQLLPLVYDELRKLAAPRHCDAGDSKRPIGSWPCYDPPDKGPDLCREPSQLDRRLEHPTRISSA